MDDGDRVIPGGHQEGVGYKYSDLIFVDNSTLVPFEYKVRNEKTNLTYFTSPDIDFVFDFKDFKYLSHQERFQKKITDPEIAAGLKNDYIDVNFRGIWDKD